MEKEYVIGRKYPCLLLQERGEEPEVLFFQNRTALRQAQEILLNPPHANDEVSGLQVLALNPRVTFATTAVFRGNNKWAVKLWDGLKWIWHEDFYVPSEQSVSERSSASEAAAARNERQSRSADSGINLDTDVDSFWVVTKYLGQVCYFDFQQQGGPCAMVASMCKQTALESAGRWGMTGEGYTPGRFAELLFSEIMAPHSPDKDSLYLISAVNFTQGRLNGPMIRLLGLIPERLLGTCRWVFDEVYLGVASDGQHRASVSGAAQRHEVRSILEIILSNILNIS